MVDRVSRGTSGRAAGGSGKAANTGGLAGKHSAGRLKRHLPCLLLCLVGMGLSGRENGPCCTATHTRTSVAIFVRGTRIKLRMRSPLARAPRPARTKNKRSLKMLESQQFVWYRSISSGRGGCLCLPVEERESGLR